MKIENKKYKWNNKLNFSKKNIICVAYSIYNMLAVGFNIFGSFMRETKRFGTKD